MGRKDEFVIFRGRASFDDVGRNTDDSRKVGDVADDDRPGTDDGGLADGDSLDDSGTDADEGKWFYGDMTGDADTRADVCGSVDDGFVIDDASGVEDGGVFDFDEGADVHAGGDDDVFADLGGIGDIGTGVDGRYETDRGVVKGFGIGVSDAIVTDCDLLLFLQEHLDPHHQQLTSAIEMSIKNHHQIAKNSSIGLGWHFKKRYNQPFVWHNGATGGYASFAGFNRKNQTAVVILCNAAVSHELTQTGFQLLENFSK